MVKREYSLIKLIPAMFIIFCSTTTSGRIMQQLVKTEDIQQGYYDVNTIAKAQVQNLQKTQNPYYEFIRTSSISMGLYVIPIGGEDLQEPHTADELYYVIKGKANLIVGDKDYKVSAGSLIYVAKGVKHQFHNILQELSVLVFFGPAEKTPKIRWLLRKGLSPNEISEILDVDRSVVDAVVKHEKEKIT